MAASPSPLDGSRPLDDPLNTPPTNEPPPAPATEPPPAPATDPPPAAATEPPPTMGAGPAGDPAPPPGRGQEPGPGAGPAPGLADQIRATRDSARRLLDAHVELARSEFADIGDAVKRAVAFAGIAVGALLFAAVLVAVGMPLFLGEWLFGSIGWGILIGLLLMVALAVAFAVLALGPAVKGAVGRSILVAALIAIVVGVILGLDLSNRAWTGLADNMAANLDPGSRPLIVAVAAIGIAGAVIGLVGGLRAGGAGAAIGGVLAGAIAGVFVGALTAIAPGRRIGAAIGISVGLVAWVVLIGASAARGGFDTDALKDRFWPARTIEVTKETIEWARERMPLSRRS